VLVAGAAAAGTGAFVTLYGRHRAVLITYPEPTVIDGLVERSPACTP
jgi:hypothetical protein